MVSRTSRPGRRVGNRAIGRVRREHRHRAAAGRHGLGFGQRDLVGGHAAGRGEAVEHAIPRGARRGDRPVGPSAFRRLRQRDQERRFAERQPARLLAEIGERGGADALDIAAIGREIEIERQYLVLAERALELDRAHDLAELGRQAAAAARL